MRIVACCCMLLYIVIKCPYCCVLLHVIVECTCCTDSEFPMENRHSITTVANTGKIHVITAVLPVMN